MNSNRFARLLASGILLVAAGTNAAAQQPVADTAIAVTGDDSAMNAAIDQARATIGQFIERLDHPPASQTDISLKVRLSDGRAIEHVWLSNVQHHGNEFSGRLSNDVEHLANYHLGDSVSVRLDRVSDWLAIDGGRLIGGYSIRLLRARMSPADRAAFDRQVRFRVD